MLSPPTTAATLALALLLGGCALTPERVAPPVEPPAAFTTAGTKPLPSRWWRDFEDPALNRLVNRALAGNFDLRTAWSRLRAARATARLAGADRALLLDGEAGWGRTAGRTDGDRFRSRGFSLDLGAAYEIDLWGRLGNRVAAARLDLEATAEEVQAAAITLSAGVATAWYEWAETVEQLQVLAGQVEANTRILTLVRERFRRGKVQAADVLRQTRLLETTRALRIQVQGRREVVQHRLAVLLGEPPQRAPEGANPLLVDPPPLPAAGVPARLIRKRPDLRAAWLAVQAAEHRLAAALADRFPRLALTGSAGTDGEKLKDLFDNWLTTLAAGLVQPLLDGGERRAEADRRRALAAQTLNRYGQVVLEALQEVEDALSQDRRQTEYVASLRRQLATAGRIRDRLRDRYLNGQVDYLAVLEALTSYQTLERSLVTARRRHLDIRIALCRALATGWQAAVHPTPGDPDRERISKP